MTLRDYFAAAVLQGTYSDGQVLAALGAGNKPPAEEIAEACYEMADAMLAERAR